MKKTIKGAILLQACACLLFGSAAFAQDKPAERFTYVTYHICDVTQQERADEIFAEVQKPIYDAAVADGTIKSWGWMAHHTGGIWRRSLYYGSDSVQGLLDAQKKVGDQVDAKNKKLSDEFGKICNSHEDYIWRTVAGNIGTTARGDASFSVYHVCDQGREEQADALMTQVFASVFDKLLAEGKILSWGWNEHIVGGDYRRLSTISAKDTKTLMEARASIVEAIYDNPLGDTLTDICGPHVDYMWDITSQNP
jgi:hypothetical protein